MAKKLEYQELLDSEKLTLEDLPMAIRKRINVIRPLIAKFNQNPTPKMKEAIIKSDVEIAEMIADYIEKDLPEHEEGDDDDDDSNNNKRSSSKNNRNNDDDDDDNDGEGSEDEDENDNKPVNKSAKKVVKPVQKTAEELEAERLASEKAAMDKLAADKAAAEKAAADKIAADKAAAEKEAEEEQKRKDAAKTPITNFGNLEMEKKIMETIEKNNGFIPEKDLISIIGKTPEYPIQKVFSIKLKKVFLKSLYQLI